MRLLLTGEWVDAGWEAVLNQAPDPGLRLYLEAQQLYILFLLNFLLSMSGLPLFNGLWFLQRLWRSCCRSWGG